MRRFFSILCVLCLLTSLFSACEKEKNVSSKRYDYDLDEYVTVPDPKAVKAVFADPTVCTDAEIDEAIFQIMLSNAAFTEKENGKVEKYNKVQISFSMEIDGKELTEFSQDNKEMIIGYEGNSDTDAALAKALVGKAVGEKAEAEYTYPASAVELGVYAGKTAKLFGEVKKIYQQSVSECTDDFVKKIGDENLNTVEDLRMSLETQIIEGKESAKSYAVLNAYLDGVEVKKYPEAELQAYVNNYMASIDAAAEQMEMTREEYITVCLESTLEETKKTAESDAKMRVKNDLACIQGSRLMGTTLTDEEYKDGLESYFSTQGEGFQTAEAFEEYYTKEIIFESILWDKTFQVMMENAIRVEAEA